jgi:glutamine amidotransferase
MICIVNYGLGNLNSIRNIIKKIGGESKIIDDVGELKEARKLILPGIGAFDHGMQFLNQRGWVDELNSAVLERKVPVLGICLGMQLMCKGSEEGVLPGLGWFDADVRRFRIPEGSPYKIPHMGWNALSIKKDNPLIGQKEEEQRFYFVHSYHVVCNNTEDVLASAVHGYEFTASISRDNIYATQFHPEKSHRFGMELLKNFIAI